MSTAETTIPAAVRPAMKRIGLMAASKDIDYVKILSGLVLALATTVGTLGLYVARGALSRQDAMESRQQAADLWIAETKSNRFTASDGARTWEAIAAGQRDVVKLQTELSMANVQFRDTLMELKTTMRSVDDRLRAMEKKP